MAKPGETVGDWYMALDGITCWHKDWVDPYSINLPSLTVWVEDIVGGLYKVAGPFDTIEAAKAAYLMLRDG